MDGITPDEDVGLDPWALEDQAIIHTKGAPRLRCVIPLVGDEAAENYLGLVLVDGFACHEWLHAWHGLAVLLLPNQCGSELESWMLKDPAVDGPNAQCFAQPPMTGADFQSIPAANPLPQPLHQLDGGELVKAMGHKPEPKCIFDLWGHVVQAEILRRTRLDIRVFADNIVDHPQANGIRFDGADPDGGRQQWGKKGFEVAHGRAYALSHICWPVRSKNR